MRSEPPLTWDKLKKLKGYERTKALREYYEWLDEQRKEDRRIQTNMNNVRHRIKVGNKCKNCGKICSPRANLCINCFREKRKKVTIIDI